MKFNMSKRNNTTYFKMTLGFYTNWGQRLLVLLENVDSNVNHNSHVDETFNKKVFGGICKTKFT